MRPTRPLYFMLNLAGSGHDFRGVCFSVAYTTPNGKSCRSFPQNRSIYHNSRCTHPLKRSQTLSDAKNTKRQENARVNQKNAPESFLEALHNYSRKRCAIDFDCSEGRTGQNDKFSRPGWKVLHGDFSSHLPHGIFVTFQKKAHQNQPDTLCFCQRGFRVTALLIRSLQLLMTGIQSRPEHPGYSLPDMQPE